MKHFYFLISVLLLFSACETKVNPTISVKSKIDSIDSLYITNIITGELLFKLPVIDNSIIENTNDSTILASISTKDESISYLTILHPKKSLEIKIQSDSSLTTNSIGDSLANYLWVNTPKFASYNTPTDTDSILPVFDRFRALRAKKINNHSGQLLPEEQELLLYQNDARVYSYMFIVGRLSKNLDPNHTYFEFINRLENNNKWAKSLPANLLFKYEIKYIKENDSLTNLYDFLNYIEKQTSNNDLSDYLKYVYIKNIVETPYYWQRHQKLFNSEILKSTLKTEQKNNYSQLLNKATSSFFKIQKGELASNFSAKRKDGSTFNLSDYKGKLVYIDNWASWCAPCIRDRPNVLQLIEKYKDNPKIEILMVSLDSDKKIWKNLLKQRNELNYDNDVFIKNGLNTNYANNYLIKTIPKYILIGADGLIINSDIGPPSISVEQIIQKELDALR